MLCQLSYTRIHAANSAPTRYVTLPVFTFVPAAGLEPTTSVLSGQCSHLLSYAGKDENKIVEGAPYAARALHAALVQEANEHHERPKGGNKTRDARPLNAFCFRQ